MVFKKEGGFRSPRLGSLSEDVGYLVTAVTEKLVMY